MFRNKLLASITVFLGAWALPCGAATIPFDVNNTIISFRIDGVARGGYATDTLGLFGTAGADLGGQTMSISMSWDATFMAENCNNGGESSVCGSEASAAGYVRESVTVGGVTVIPTTAASMTTQVLACYACSRGHGLIQFNGPVAQSEFLSGAYQFFDPAGLTRVTNPQLNQAATMVMLNVSNGFAVTVGSSGNSEQLQMSSSTISDTSAPEPSSWMLLGLGIGGVGVVRRRLRARQ